MALHWCQIRPLLLADKHVPGGGTSGCWLADSRDSQQQALVACRLDPCVEVLLRMESGLHVVHTLETTVVPRPVQLLKDVVTVPCQPDT